MIRSSLWSSLSIYLLIPSTINKEYKQKSFVELLVQILTDSVHFAAMNDKNRSHQWSSLSIYLLIPSTFNKEYKQKSFMELLVHILTDSCTLMRIMNLMAHFSIDSIHF